MKRGVYVFLLALALLAGGCAQFRRTAAPPLSAHLAEQGRAGECAGFFATLDRAVRTAGVADRQARRINGFPYLRVDRFLASFAGQQLAGPAVRAWVDRLAGLDREARATEIANLPGSVRKGLPGPAGTSDLVRATLSCGELLRDIDLAAPENLARLRASARVEPDYSTLDSLLGLYPLTSLFVRAGIAKYHHDVLQTYQAELAQLPLAGHLVRYVPAAPAAPAPIATGALVDQAAADSLGIPEFTAAKQRQLFQDHAPVWEVDAAGGYDRIGSPYWAGPLRPAVDPARPRVFTLLSHTRFQGEILPQLNYVVWFSERPRQGAFDLYGGLLDGLIWRVTLDRHGAPLLYDTIHNCGCYHMFFPNPKRITPRGQAASAEPLLIPQLEPDLFAGGRLVIRVASGTHYIDRVYVDKDSAAGVAYSLAAYNELRSLPVGAAGRRSLFGPDGLVPGTERGERFLLWPTGVPSPGAMRQWGNHATAFLGRRHFDDPELLEQLFLPAEQAGR